MSASGRWCRLEEGEAHRTVRLEGAWRLSRLAELETALVALGPLGNTRVIDGEALEEIDTAAALALWRYLRSAGVEPSVVKLHNFGASHARIVELVRSRLEETDFRPRVYPLRTLAQVGRQAMALGSLLHGHLDFLGRTLHELARVLVRPRLLRLKELTAQFDQVCINAIPVVGLVTFLIGVVVAYLLGMQAEKYGANIFVVDGVALGMTREFSPIIVATIVAGRSGAAFTAQLGTMKLTEEIDAIRTIGLSPMQVLIVPRVVALMVALPLLVFVGDLLGIAGAMLVADAMLDITPTTFLERLHEALAPRHYLIGLGKAPVFALFIAVIGCRMGMSASRDTRSIGINTTSTVVQSIVAVILLDAFFAVFFQEIGL